MYGGLNLYNNGFSAGWVAIIIVPVVESFMRHFEDRKRRKMQLKAAAEAAGHKAAEAGHKAVEAGHKAVDDTLKVAEETWQKLTHGKKDDEK